MVNYKELRITKLKEYLYNIVMNINKETKEVNANALSKNINSYSLDRMPVEAEVQRWVDGTTIERDVYTFRSRCAYSYKEIDNLLNVGFFEIFEETIKKNNENKILPDILGIESIECLNCGTLMDAENGTAEFNIQIQITYKEETGGMSL